MKKKGNLIIVDLTNEGVCYAHHWLDTYGIPKYKI
jgi:hypothetical protein